MQQLITEQLNSCTIIFTAHRLETIMPCDRIVMLAQGSSVDCEPAKGLHAGGKEVSAFASGPVDDVANKPRCCVWYLTASVGVNSCLQCVMRGQQRERHGIEGSAFGDFCGSLCCACCACCTLIQEEKESVVRVTGMDPKTKIVYQPIDQDMHYPA